MMECRPEARTTKPDRVILAQVLSPCSLPFAATAKELKGTKLSKFRYAPTPNNLATYPIFEPRLSFQHEHACTVMIS
jgi:hypothetical protein